MSNPSYENAITALQTHLAENMPTGFGLTDIRWEGVGNWNTPANSNWGRTSTISFDDSTYPGQWSRFTGLYVIDLFFVLPSNGSIISDIGLAVDELTASFSNKEFNNVSTYNIAKNNIESDSTHLGRQINVNFSYEGRI